MILLPVIAIVTKSINPFIPGLEEAIIIFWSILFIWYFLLGFTLPNNLRFRRFRLKGFRAGIIIFSILCGIVLLFAVSGLVFRFNMFPGAWESGIIGLCGTGTLLVVSWLAFRNVDIPEMSLFYIRTRLILFFVLSLINTLLTKQNVNHIYYGQYPELVELYDRVDYLERDQYGSKEHESAIIAKADLREEIRAQVKNLDEVYYGRGNIRHKRKTLSDTTYSISYFNRYVTNQLDSIETFVLVDLSPFKYKVDIHNVDKISQEMEISETIDSIYFEIYDNKSLLELHLNSPEEIIIPDKLSTANGFQLRRFQGSYRGFLRAFTFFTIADENDSTIYSGVEERTLHFKYNSEEKTRSEV